MYEVVFLEAFSQSNDFIIESFLANLVSVFTEVRNTEEQIVALEKKGQFCEDFFGISEILEHHFPSKHFQNLSVVSICNH